MGDKASVPFADVPSSQHFNVFTNLEALWASVFHSFYWGFVKFSQLVKLLVTWLSSISGPSPLHWAWATESSHPLIISGLSDDPSSNMRHLGDSLWVISLALTQSMVLKGFLINNERHTNHSRNPRCFRCIVAETLDKDQTCFFLI